MCVCLVSQSCPTLCNPMDCNLPGSSVHGDSLGKNTRMGCHALLQGIFPTQGSSPGLPHCRWILYQLSHQGGPIRLEWVAYPFSRGSSQPRNWTRVSCIAGSFFTSWATREQCVGSLQPLKGLQIILNYYELMYSNKFVKLLYLLLSCYLLGAQIFPSLAQGSFLKLHKPFLKF